MSIGILNLLTLIFVIAKILGLVQFSWLVCLLPTIISIGFGFAIFGGIALMALLAVIFDK